MQAGGNDFTPVDAVPVDTAPVDVAPVDVVIVGAGIVGAACARALAREGLSVIVVDRGQTTGATSSSGEGNLLLSDKAPGAELLLAQYSASLWPAVVDELADELGAGFPSVEYDRKGGLVVATTDAGAAPLLAFAQSQRGAGVDARVLSTAEALELEPQLNPAITAAVHYPDDAQVQPVIASEAFLASARRGGVRVLTNAVVTGPVLDARGALIGVTTSRGTVRAARVLVAAGPWSGEVSGLLGAPLPVRPRRGVVLVTTRMPHRIFHKVYDADYVGAVESNAADLQTSSVVESTGSGTVLIGSSRQQIGFDDRFRVDVLRELAVKALRLFPFLAGAPVMRSYGGFRPFMPDHLPIIGEDPRLPGLWHATGHEGAGIGLSLGTGAMIADLMAGRTPGLDATAFSPARGSLAAHLEGARP
ncbi:NAD(P)/FAD-dependent oxidoreductase [Compostimonas suwonensis]|uniref:Glycine/D-amino acid oxidase-like deaminating enzyme n=1 Tax=Compostimonas suwonensis TaxID=1048394 RepID=A0A2M9C582_9MICO|nr:FAD-dependent oxidoreductase [Compostimonas suwonensis]PJJ65678.1 glycine/D-amino acid oxidase-like deaminating enzyme [Compostimonas suwonensis]